MPVKLLLNSTNVIKTSCFSLTPVSSQFLYQKLKLYVSAQISFVGGKYGRSGEEAQLDSSCIFSSSSSDSSSSSFFFLRGDLPWPV